MHAIAAVAEVALRCNDGFSNSQHLIGCAKSDNVADARISGRITMRHTHTAADGDVEAKQFIA